MSNKLTSTSTTTTTTPKIMTYEEWLKDNYQPGDNPPEEVAKKGYDDYLAANQGGSEDLKAWADSNITHPDDRKLFDALTEGELAYLRTLENTPGGQERMQFIRMTPEDRAKVMKAFNMAYEEAYETKGQGVKLSDEEKADIKPPLKEEVVNDTQTSEEEAAKIAEAEANANAGGNNDNGNGGGEYRPAPPSENQKYKLKSIFQAYADGDIDKNTRDYMVVNTLGTFAKNLGKDVGNVAAAYSGGTMDNQREEDLWTKRNEQMAQAGTEGEMSTVPGSREQREALQQMANLTATELNNNSVEENQRLAKIAESALYTKDANGNYVLKYKPDSKAFKDISRTITALRQGGGVNESMLSQFWHWISAGSGY